MSSSPGFTNRRIDPLTAVGALIMLVGLTALLTYFALIAPGKRAAQGGPPEEFLLAATRQAEANTGGGADAAAGPTPTVPLYVTPGRPVQRWNADGASAALPLPTVNPYGDWPLPDYVERRYWLSIPMIQLEAPVIALAPRSFTKDGSTEKRIPVPNSYSVAWDSTSAEPGLGGNVVLTGHNNLYGAVFGDLEQIVYGAEVSIWTELGVFTYYVSTIQLLPEEGEPAAVRQQNLQWIAQTGDNRLTLITCGPGKEDTHRLVIVATR